MSRRCKRVDSKNTDILYTKWNIHFSTVVVVAVVVNAVVVVIFFPEEGISVAFSIVLSVKNALYEQSH